MEQVEMVEKVGKVEEVEKVGKVEKVTCSTIWTELFPSVCHRYLCCCR